MKYYSDTLCSLFWLILSITKTELLGNYWNHVFVYFEGNETLNRDEGTSLLEQENNKEPTLIETIFTVLSYCTLSPKSLGIAFESYMEKELLWNCLYNMTGISFINKHFKSYVKCCLFSDVVSIIFTIINQVKVC